MEDLRRRDFSLNAIAISLNRHRRGLLLDPTNGLSDVERAEVRALTIHSFTNQPVRLLRVLRFAARMGFKMELRTQEWFDLAIERELQHTIAPRMPVLNFKPRRAKSGRRSFSKPGKSTICSGHQPRSRQEASRIRSDRPPDEST